MADDWLKEKIGKIDDSVTEIKVTLAKQSVILEDHTRRSLANEEANSLLRTELYREITPLKKFVNQVGGAFKLIGLISSLAGIIFGLVEVLLYMGVKL